jgi:hypothetical protein
MPDRADVRVPEPRTTVEALPGGLPFVHVMVVFLQIGNGNTQLNQLFNLARCRTSRVPPSLITLSGSHRHLDLDDGAVRIELLHRHDGARRRIWQ